MVPEAALIDPERPLSPDELMREVISTATRRRAVPGLLRLAMILLCLAAVAIVWRWASVHTFIDYDTIGDWIPTSTDSSLAPLWIAGVFTLATLVLAPVTLLIIAIGATFGPVLGFTYALGGSMVSAIVHYGLGRIAGKETVRWIAGS